MQAYKLKGTINPSGHLIITEPIEMPPGEVEVIILQPVVPAAETSTVPEIEPQAAKPKREVQCSIPILKEWLEKTEPAPPDFDADRAKWEYLKEKHNL